MDKLRFRYIDDKDSDIQLLASSRLLETGNELCDCRFLLASGIKVSSHLAILASHSHIITSMINKQSKIIDLSSQSFIDIRTLLCFMVYLYCGTFQYKWDPSSFIEYKQEEGTLPSTVKYNQPSHWKDFLYLMLLSEHFQMVSLKRECLYRLKQFVQAVTNKELFDLWKLVSKYSCPEFITTIKEQLIERKIAILKDQIKTLEQFKKNTSEEISDEKLILVLKTCSALTSYCSIDDNANQKEELQ